jgi:hypothetical protein
MVNSSYELRSRHMVFDIHATLYDDPQAAALLEDYGGNVAAFENDHTCLCGECRTRFFAGYHCMEAEFNADGEPICPECSDGPLSERETYVSQLREHGTWRV